MSTGSKPFLAALMLGALLLGGCAHRAPVAPLPVAPPPFDRAGEIAAIIAALDRGDVVTARPRVAELLAHNPADPAGLILRRAIDGDPRTMLGARSFAYTLKPGETLADLATRFLGNPLEAYALARYNGIAVPAEVRAGMVLRIPGTAPVVAPAHKSRPAPRKPAPPVATPAARASQAAKLRHDALAALARGDRANAVTLLRRAAALDPSNPLVRRDLARALGAAAR